MAARITPYGYGRMFNAALKSGLVAESQITGLLSTLEDMAMGFQADSDQAGSVGDSDRAERYCEMASDLYGAIEDEVETDADRNADWNRGADVDRD